MLFPACSNPSLEVPRTPQVSPHDSSGESPTQLCNDKDVDQVPSYTLVEPGTKAELLWKAEFVPWRVRSSPDGRVLAITEHGDSIYVLRTNGSLDVFFHCPGAIIDTFAAASDGSIWFLLRDDRQLYRIGPGGSVEVISSHAHRNLEAGSDGAVYAFGNGLQRFDKNGTREDITYRIHGRKFAIGPNEEIVAFVESDLVLVSETGAITTLASGYAPEAWPTFGPDGLLYITNWSGVEVINLQTGTNVEIAWLRDINLSEAGTFAPDERLLLYHPNTDVYAIDLEAKTVEIYHQVSGNSWAMAVSPGDGVYIAYGDKQARGKTTIYRILDFQTLALVATVPYGFEHAMTFNSHGIGFLAVGDKDKGGAVIRFDPTDGGFDEYHRTQCHPVFITTHPQTDLPWWYDCDHFESLDEEGNLLVIEGIPGGQHPSLAITPDGVFYAIFFSMRSDPNAPFQHRLYRWDGARWVEVADLTQSDPAITLSTFVACSDGRIYTIESLDSDHLPVNRSTFNAVRRLESDGALTLLGFDFSIDASAADCDPHTGRIIFTSGFGVFAVTPP
jgi:outer membrane protein assembly factor BamB